MVGSLAVEPRERRKGGGEVRRPKPHSRYYAIALCVGKRCALQSRIPKLIVQTFEVGWPSSIELFRAAFVEDRRSQLEDTGQFLDKLLRERVGVVNQQDGPAECV